MSDFQGDERPMVRLIDGIEVYHLDYESLSRGGFSGNDGWKRFANEVLPKCGTCPGAPSVGCHGIKGSSGDGYDIPGTKSFSEYYLCGAGDGIDNQPRQFGDKLLSFVGESILRIKLVS